MPFTVDQFFDVFQAYNEATGPASVILTILAATAALSLVWRTSLSPRFVLIVLALLWAWSGGVYHIGFFSAVNPAAFGFGAAFIVEALLLLWLALGSNQLSLTAPSNSIRTVFAACLMGYAILIYPLLSAAAGHIYPRPPAFGAPCPVTILTLGFLMLIRVPWYAAVIPVLWAVVGSSAAALFGIYADLGLCVGAILYILFSFRSTA